MSRAGAPRFPLKLHAADGYQAPELRRAPGEVTKQVKVEIVRRSDQAKGLVLRLASIRLMLRKLCNPP